MDEYLPTGPSQLMHGREGAIDMPNTIEITMTRRGFEVTVAGRTALFPTIDEVLGYTQQRLRRAHELREMSARCE